MCALLPARLSFWVEALIPSIVQPITNARSSAATHALLRIAAFVTGDSRRVLPMLTGTLKRRLLL
jgi:hypothetical protein